MAHPWPSRRLADPPRADGALLADAERGRRLDLLAGLVVIGGGGAPGTRHGYGRRRGEGDARGADHGLTPAPASPCERAHSVAGAWHRTEPPEPSEDEADEWGRNSRTAVSRGVQLVGGPGLSCIILALQFLNGLVKLASPVACLL